MIRMRIADSYFHFVNAHLAADSSAVDRRNSDFWEIVKRANFPFGGSGGKYRHYLDWVIKNPCVATGWDSSGRGGLGSGSTGPAGLVYDGVSPFRGGGGLRNVAGLYDCE